MNYFLMDKIKNNPKVYIGVPSHDSTVYTQFVISLLDHDRNNDIEVAFFNGDSLVPRIRNYMISKYYHEHLLTKQFDYFLFQDSDVQTGENALKKALSRNVDVLFSPVPLKNSKYVSNYGLVQSVVGFEKEISTHLYKVTFAATGFCLLSNNAISALIKDAEKNKNFYYDSYDRKIYDIFKIGSNGKGFYYSEDWYLCKTLKKLGFDIYVDSSIEIWHWSSPETYFYRPICELSENILSKDLSSPLPENIKHQRWVTNDFEMIDSSIFFDGN